MAQYVQQMTRIAYLTAGLGRAGGANKASVDILASLLATGATTAVISNWRCKLPAQVAGRPLARPAWITPSKELPWPVDHTFPRRAAAWLVTTLRDPGWARRLRRLGPPDLTVVNSFGNDSFLDRMAAINPGLRRRTMMIVHGAPDERTFRASGHDVPWALEVLRRYDSLVFVSSRVRDQWLALGSLAGKDSFYIPNCCREDQVLAVAARDRQAIRKRLGFPEDGFVVTCVASLQPHKGQDLLVGHFPNSLSAVPGLTIYLVGPDSSAWARTLRRQIEESRFANRLRVLGARSNALEYIYAADTLVLPSRAEAMPLVILEAMALRTPVIASAIAGIPELIEHEQSGLLFCPDRPVDLVAALARMAGNQQERQLFAERASQTYWSSFSRACQVERYQAAIDSLVN